MVSVTRDVERSWAAKYGLWFAPMGEEGGGLSSMSIYLMND